MDQTEIKAAIYDQMAFIEQCQKTIQALNGKLLEIQNKEKEDAKEGT